MSKREKGDHTASVVATTVLILATAVVLLVFLPVYRDRKAQAAVRPGVMVALQVAKRLQNTEGAASVKKAVELLPASSKDLLLRVGTIELAPDGAVRLTFKSPSDLAGKRIEVRRISKSPENIVLECRAPDFKGSRLPAGCRAGANPISASDVQ